MAVMAWTSRTNVLAGYVMLSHATFFLFLYAGVPNFSLVNVIFQNRSANASNLMKHPAKLFCLIITIETNHMTKARAVNRTWARRCDGHVFTSTREDAYLPSFAVSGNAAKAFLNTRLQHSLKRVRSYYMQGFDWLYVTDDDTYVIIENLKYFLSRFDANHPYYFGYPYPTSYKGKPFCFGHGGSGYAISKTTLQMYVEKGLNSKPPLCPSNGPFPGHMADINVGFCLWQLGINLNFTADINGRQRFVKENPIDILRNKQDGEVLFYGYRDVITFPSRRHEAMSVEAISFHYMLPGDIYLVDFLIYNLALGGDIPRDRFMLQPRRVLEMT